MEGASDRRDLLRFLTCGSVDDGKSTLIGRLLLDTKSVTEDQAAALQSDSGKHGTQGPDIDLALLVDGLQAEREQGITIDVAYRYFATPRRSFIVADAPGHEQYTRNMATGASTAQLAVILVDARKGLITQTRRHTYIAALLGIRDAVLAVNKMDLVDFDQAVFDDIVDAYLPFAAKLGITAVTAVPISAKDGDNVCKASPWMPWYEGPSLLRHLEEVDVQERAPPSGFVLPVQWVSRPNAAFRGYAGTIADGQARVGDRVVIEPARTETSIAGILAPDREVDSAAAGQAVTLILADDVDVSRGDIVRHADRHLQVTDQVQAHVIWMSANELIPGRQYMAKVSTRIVAASVTEIKHAINVNTAEHVAAKTLHLNDVAVCNVSFAGKVVCDSYAGSPALGALILIDRMSNETVGAAMIDFGLRRADNLSRQKLTLNKEARGIAMGQKPMAIWLTGLSGAGKSTVANRIEEKLFADGRKTYVLDGDNVRFGLNRDLGFTDADRVENVRRFAEVAKLMVDAGLIVLVSVISPFRSERDMARGLFEDGEFFEIFVDASLAVCEQRDVKGLYGRARKGEIKNFTGIDSPYEPPLAPDLRLDTGSLSPDEAADRVIALIDRGA